MARYVVYRVSDGLVVNTVEWDGNTATWTPPPGTATFQTDSGNVGDTFTPPSGPFTPPAPPPPPPSPIRSVTATMSPYAVVDTDQVILCDTTNGPVVVVLPLSPADARVLNVKKITTDQNSITVSGNGKSIDASSAITTAAVNFPNIQMIYDSLANGWRII